MQAGYAGSAGFVTAVRQAKALVCFTLCPSNHAQRGGDHLCVATGERFVEQLSLGLLRVEGIRRVKRKRAASSRFCAHFANPFSTSLRIASAREGMSGCFRRQLSTAAIHRSEARISKRIGISSSSCMALT
jgi:hypothetical protein